MDARAPLDEAAVRRCLEPFGLAVGLPTAAYTSPEVFAWEREHFFDPSWMCTGRTGTHARAEDERELHGWSFVRANADGVDFDEQFGNLGDHLAPYEPERLVVAARHSYEVAANWKLVHENYQECYHCSEIHPALCKVTPPDSGYSIDIQGMYVAGPMDLRDGVETMSMDGRSGGESLRGLSGNQLREVGYFGVWPNLLISPHPDYVLTHRLEALDVDRTFIECEWLFPPETAERPGFDPAYAVEFWDITNREDWHACESLQRGVTSRGHRPGPLSVAWEAGTYMFVGMLARGYLEGRVSRAQRPGGADVPRYETLASARGGRGA
jgi:Rieske 2Fe-2S family protein